MNRFSRIALLLYCAVLFIIPLSYLHLENLLSDTNIFANQEHQEIDLLVLIHEVLFAHLSNITDHLSRSTDRIFDQLIDQTSEILFPDVAALKSCLLLPGLVACTFYVLRRYSSGKGRALPQTIFCYRLFEHSPPHFSFR